MGTLLVREAVERFSAMAGDFRPAQFTRWRERDIIAYFNDGQRALAKYLPTVGARTDAMKLAPGSRQALALVAADCLKPAHGAQPSVAVRGISLSDVVRNMGADGTAPGNAITLATRDTLDAANRAWHMTAGSEVENFSFDPRTPLVFYVSPPVPSSGLWAEVAWMAQPSEIPAGGQEGQEIYRADGDNAAVLSIDDLYLDDLLHYVCARAFMQETEDTDPASAQFHVQMFLQSLNAQVAALTGHNPNLQVLPFAPTPASAAR